MWEETKKVLKRFLSCLNRGENER